MVTQKQAAAHILAMENTASSFLGFVRAIYPNFMLAPFQLELIHILDQLERGSLLGPHRKPVYRLMINMPPRHGKSWLASTLFPLYYLARKPKREVLATSYNAELAKTFGRQVRDHAMQKMIAQAFPEFAVHPQAKAADDWKTTEGGSYFACGIGGGTPGRAANCLLIDDPVKARKEADSATYRNHVWSYYNSALLTRKQPEPDGTPAIEIMVLTRWHPDDPAGRIQETDDWKEGDWYHISLDAYIDSDINLKIPRKSLPPDDPDYLPPETVLRNLSPGKRRPVKRPKRAALWPERFPLEALEKIERRDKREFAALYRQQPFVQGGNLIKPKWFQTSPENTRPNISVVTCDTAFKKSQQSDYSVFLHAGIDDNGDIHILNVIRDKMEFPALKRRAITFNAQLRGTGLRGFYVEDKASGQSLIQELRQQSGLAVIPYRVPPGHDKVERLSSVLPLIEGGRVHLPGQAVWLDDFIDECESFPSGRHDDQVDATVMALDILSRMSYSQGPDAWGGALIANVDSVKAKSLSGQFQDIRKLANQWGE